MFKNLKPDANRAYSEYADLLYRVSYGQLGNEADSCDAVQDVFLKYLKSAPDFASCDHEKAWLLRVCVNQCRDMLKKRSVRDALPLEDAHHLAAEDEKGEGEVFEMLSRLPEIYREIVVMHCLEGLPLKDACGVLGISQSAAKMRLARGRELLRKIRKEGEN